MKDDDRIAFHEQDLALHDLLLDALGFERVKTAVYAARAKLDRMRLFLCTPQRQAFTIREHEMIFEALRTRDPAAAGLAMERHLDMVMSELASLATARPDVFETRATESLPECGMWNVLNTVAMGVSPAVMPSRRAACSCPGVSCLKAFNKRRTPPSFCAEPRNTGTILSS